MTLQDIFDQLAAGELSQVFTGSVDAEGNGILPENRKQVFLHVKLGITELHKRFLLRERELTLSTTPDRQVYVLDPRYAQSNTQSREPVKYIMDSGDAFTSDLFKIERVYDFEGNEMALNQIDDKESVRTSAYNTLLLPDTYEGTSVRVVVRTDHEPFLMPLVESAPAQVPVNLPGTHLWALTLFVASRMLNPVGMSNEFHEGNNYLAKFEGECQRLLNTNFQLQRDNEPTRFESRGWV